MSPTELFHEARLTEAIGAQRAVVAARPGDVAERLLLCEFLSFTADRDEVRRQFDQLRQPPPDVLEYDAEWRALLHADDSRHAGQPPDTLGTRTAQHEWRKRSDCHCRWYQEDLAAETLDDADEQAPWVEGHVDGRPFDGWRDADGLLGPLLEVFRGERFCWVGLEQVRKLRLDEAPLIRDIVYRPATIWLADGSLAEVFIPGLYTGTANHPEDGIRAGFGVDWVEEAGITRGLGARTFLFGEEELDLNEFRQVEVRPS